jgi:hypothetical protein
MAFCYYGYDVSGRLSRMATRMNPSLFSLPTAGALRT